MRLVLTISFVVFLVSSSYGNLGVRVKERTKSGKTLILNIGALNEFRLRDKAVLVLSDAFESEIVRTDLVATISAVKVDDAESVWYVQEVFNEKALQEDKKFILMAPKLALKGRAKLRTRRKALIKSKKQKTEDVLSDFEEGWDRTDLVKRDGEYFKQLDLIGRSEFTEEEFVLADIFEWVERNEDKEKLYPKAIYRSSNGREFTENVKLETYEKMVQHFIKTGNQEFFRPSEFSKNVEDDKSMRMFQNTYEKVVEDRFLEEEQKKRRYNELLDKGPNWSEDMSDRDLAKTLDEYGIAAEIRRRESVFVRTFDYQMALSFGMNLADNQTSLDTRNGRTNNTDLSLGVEYYLFKRYPSMERFTIEWSLRRAFDSSSVPGGLNAVTSETSGAMSLDYHPFLAPGISQRNVFFVGTTIRLGRTKLDIPTENSEALYNSNSFLGLRSGIKYSFRNGFGVRLMLSYETMRLDKTEANSTGNNLPDILKYQDMKFSTGLTYFF